MESKKKIVDIYWTISEQKRTEIKIKGSRFIATACPIVSKNNAMDFLEEIRKEFYDATHNCFGYTIGFDGLEFRFSDDGEPSGTAGKPILFSLQKFDVKDIIVVVTRYFGGTKLGVGPLARAYSDSASEVLNICEKKPIYLTKPIQIFCTYEEISIIKKLIDNHAISSQESYMDSIEIIAHVPLSKIELFIGLVTSSTNGKAAAYLIK